MRRILEDICLNLSDIVNGKVRILVRCQQYSREILIPHRIAKADDESDKAPDIEVSEHARRDPARGRKPVTFKVCRYDFGLAPDGSENADIGIVLFIVFGIRIELRHISSNLFLDSEAERLDLRIERLRLVITGG